MTLPLPALDPSPVQPVRCRGIRRSGQPCGRLLTDAESVARQVGPECAERMGIVPPRRYRFAVVSGAADQPLFDLINKGEIMTVETLHENQWLSLRVVRKPEAGINGYVYSHESSCQGRKVAVLPYRVVKSPGGPFDSSARMEYLVKSEVTPCWGLDPHLSAITGGYEGGDIEDDAVRELREETGYTITRAELIPLGECYASKSADTVYSLFSVDLTDRAPGVAVGDGSRLEAESSTVWLSAGRLAEVWDPHVSTMYVRLNLGL